MAEGDAVRSARAANRAMVDGEDHRLAPAQRHDLASGLRAGPLLDQQELAAREVDARATQQHRHLQRKHQVTVEILVEAVVVAGPVPEDERRRPPLAGRVTAAQEVVQPLGKPAALAERAPPTVGDGNQPRIEGPPQRVHDSRQRVAEVLVFSAPETVPLHDDAAPEAPVIRIECDQRAALLLRQERRGGGTAGLIERSRDLLPVERGEPVEHGRRDYSIPPAPLRPGRPAVGGTATRIGPAATLRPRACTPGTAGSPRTGRPRRRRRSPRSGGPAGLIERSRDLLPVERGEPVEHGRRDYSIPPAPLRPGRPAVGGTATRIGPAATLRPRACTPGTAGSPRTGRPRRRRRSP